MGLGIYYYNARNCANSYYRWGHQKIVDTLLQHGANINATRYRPRLFSDRYRCNTPIFSALIRGQVEMFKFLQSKGAVLDDVDGKRALSYAYDKGDKHLQHILFDAGLKAVVSTSSF